MTATISLAGRAYGRIPQLADQRDHELKLELPSTVKLPKTADLRHSPHMPAIWDQGQLGSCTAHGNGRVFAFCYHATHNVMFMPSRLFIYYYERVMEGTTKEDSGAAIRDGIKVLAKEGVPPETDWAYDISKFAVPPPKIARTDALKDLIVKYESPAQTESAIETALHANLPIVCGFTVYESFESAKVAKTGIVPMPGRRESVVGGHCIVIVGYNHTTGMFICANSWGTEWGLDGYFEIPYEYVMGQLFSDFWAIQQAA